jgi:uncharacterized protein
MQKIPRWYLLYIITVLACWFTYVYLNDYSYVIMKHIKVIITMIFGAFIAGSSPEGSASIAYPVFTLVLDIAPSDARNFAFAIQSFGMTAASILILNMRIAVDWHYIKIVSLSGLIGLIVGSYYVAPHIPPKIAKLFFVSLWFSFGIVLWYINRDKQRLVVNNLPPLLSKDVIILIGFGIVGGIISSIFGTGINIFTYCLMVIFYKLSEKVATPSSVIIMTIETLAGFFIHTALLNDFSIKSKEMWLACIPFVIFIAPLGAYIINKVSRLKVANLLYAILFIQYIGALLVIKPSTPQLMMSVVIIISGVLLFWNMARIKNRQNLIEIPKS